MWENTTQVHIHRKWGIPSLETKSSTDKLLFGIKTLTKIYGGVVMFERWADVRALFEVRELIGTD